MIPAADLGYHGPVFMDSDIYKTLEAIGWELQSVGDKEPPGAQQPPGAQETARGGAFSAFAATAVALLARVQRPDGYLNSYVQASGEPRYRNLASSHEMYCDGHLFQAAIALARGAGDQEAMDIAIRLADHLVKEFAGQRNGLDGHPIIETALVELYRETGTASYRDLAAQFVEQRGHGLAGDSGFGRRYLQDHLPVRERTTEVGHVVRALYLEVGVTDVATETNDERLLDTSKQRWDDMVTTKTALTGGNGSRHEGESFGDRFELPPDRAYNETCAAIASFQWSWRLLLAAGDAKYADHMERVLYNGFAGAISSDGMRFFYVNPLQRRVDHYEKDDPGRRREWFKCACCPPNIMRLLASLHHYLATSRDDILTIHQYATAAVTGAGLGVQVETNYPWDGLVTLRVTSAPDEVRELALRVPAWSAAAGLAVNKQDESPERVPVPPDRYLRLRRGWRAGDVVRLWLDMTPRLTYPDSRVDAVRGCVAIERGPLVYCLEQTDQAARLDELAVLPGAPLAERTVTLPGIGTTIQVTALGSYVPAGPTAALGNLGGRARPARRGRPGRHRDRDPLLPVGQPGTRRDARLDPGRQSRQPGIASTREAPRRGGRAGGLHPSTLGWSIIHSQVPSGWRLATSTVALPARVVEVTAMSPFLMAGRITPVKAGGSASSSAYTRRMASVPTASRPGAKASTASGSYRATTPLTSPALARSRKSLSRSSGSTACPAASAPRMRPLSSRLRFYLQLCPSPPERAGWGRGAAPSPGGISGAGGEADLSPEQGRRYGQTRDRR